MARRVKALQAFMFPLYPLSEGRGSICQKGKRKPQALIKHLPDAVASPYLLASSLEFAKAGVSGAAVLYPMSPLHGVGLKLKWHVLFILSHHKATVYICSGLRGGKSHSVDKLTHYQIQNAIHQCLSSGFLCLVKVCHSVEQSGKYLVLENQKVWCFQDLVMASLLGGLQVLTYCGMFDSTFMSSGISD